MVQRLGGGTLQKPKKMKIDYSDEEKLEIIRRINLG
jgi:hypothetical protein